MNKDGTPYLCKLELETGGIKYMVLSWREPNSIFAEGNGEKAWVTVIGYAPRIKKILAYLDCRILDEDFDFEKMLQSLASTAGGAIEHVGMANYPERIQAAHDHVEKKRNELVQKLRKMRVTVNE